MTATGQEWIQYTGGCCFIFISQVCNCLKFTYTDTHTCPLHSLALDRIEASHSSFLKSEGKGYVEVKLVGQLAGRRCGNLAGNRFMMLCYLLSCLSHSIGCHGFACHRSQVHIRVSIGGSAFLEQEHDFSEGAVARLRGQDRTWVVCQQWRNERNHVPICSGADSLGAWPTEAA